MKAMFNGQPIFGPRGPAGPDGNPIGTIISYMGTKAPKDYLICDGAAYNIADYSKLVEFFKEQFGSANYFGGDGETTFAVPDMRNLFLRGYHGGSDEQFSGNIGQKQAGTSMPAVYAGQSGLALASSLNGYVDIENTDTGIGSKGGSRYSLGSAWKSDAIDRRLTSVIRPVNMAVLYCIKATIAEPYEDSYSTEETIIGTWIDGKPVYRRVIPFANYTFNGNNDGYGIFYPCDLGDIDDLLSGGWFGKLSSGSYNHSGEVSYFANEKRIVMMNHTFSGTYQLTGGIILEYTKTADQEVSE